VIFYVASVGCNFVHIPSQHGLSFADLCPGVPEDLLLRTQQTYLHTWLDRIRQATPPYNTVDGVTRSLPGFLYQPDILRTEATKDFLALLILICDLCYLQLTI
jgi:hypothetical protein